MLKHIDKHVNWIARLVFFGLGLKVLLDGLETYEAGTPGYRNYYHQFVQRDFAIAVGTLAIVACCIPTRVYEAVRKRFERRWRRKLRARRLKKNK